MKNITVSVDEETHRLARIHAMELDTSVSVLVQQFLRSLVSSSETALTDGKRKRRPKRPWPVDASGFGRCLRTLTPARLAYRKG